MTGTATAPASSANLGPGFDVLAIAYELRCRVTAQPAATWSIIEEGKAYSPPRDALVVRAAAALADGPFELRIDNAIPRARGLGSSAAVAAAAAAAVVRATDRVPDPGDLLEVVAGLEGHYDNAAAAVFGGCVVAAEGRFRHIELAPELEFVLGIPNDRLATSAARQALQPSFDRATVVRSLGRLAFLMEGLRSGSPEAFAGAAGDELHESSRAHLSPITGEMIKAAYAAGALHAAWSGAGPTVVAITADATTTSVRFALREVLGDEGVVEVLPVATEGWN